MLRLQLELESSRARRAAPDSGQNCLVVGLWDVDIYIVGLWDVEVGVGVEQS